MQVDSVKIHKRTMSIFCHDSRGHRYKMVSDPSLFECWVLNEGRMVRPFGWVNQDGNYEISFVTLTFREYWSQERDIIYEDVKDFMYSVHLQPPLSDPPVWHNPKLFKTLTIIFAIASITYYLYKHI
jgi:hypothetical protein